MGPLSPQEGTPNLGVVDVLDRDGQVRQSFMVHAWPLRVGRSLDNDVVLADPHVAASHLRVQPGDNGLMLTVGDTLNGVTSGSRRWRSGEQVPLAVDGPPVEFTVGRTRLRLRLPGQPLAAEMPIAAAAMDNHHLGRLAGAAAILVAGLLFNTYLDSDPDNLGRAVAGMLLASVTGAAVWCGLWSLLSKMFTHQTRFGWHLRVFLWASIAWMVADVAPRLLAFALSWPAPSSFAFIGTLGVGAVAFYYHLLAVEPARPRLLRGVALTGWLVGVAVMLWFNLQRGDRLGEELYMNHLFPPALRLAPPVSTDVFVEGLKPLQAVLDKKAKEAPSGDSNGSANEE
jgi:hypothetical protein